MSSNATPRPDRYSDPVTIPFWHYMDLLSRTGLKGVIKEDTNIAHLDDDLLALLGNKEEEKEIEGLEVRL